MRPLRLKIKGIKSFYEEQTIDFRTLSDNNIFVICGVTGAGKSTVLDCVVLALYGKKSDGLKQEEYINLRSGEGSIELLFEVEQRGERRNFSVSRTFYRAKNRSARAALLDCSTGAVLSEGEQVAKDVASLIGLTCENFTKVIVLEQGKYGEFLKATKAKRTELVGSLFKLERYRDLYSRAKTKYDLIKKEEQALNEALALLDGVTAASLAEDKREYKRLEREEKQIAQECAALSKRRAELSAEAAAYKEYRNAEDALKVSEAALNAAVEALKELRGDEKREIRDAERLERAERELSEATLKREQIAALDSGEARRAQLSSQIAEMRGRYTALRDKLRLLQELRADADKSGELAAKEAAALIERLKTPEDGPAEWTSIAAERLCGKLRLERENGRRLREKEKQAESDKQKALIELAAANAKWEETSKLSAAAAAGEREKRQRYEAAAQNAERALLDASADRLRERLSPGGVCPVCGAEIGCLPPAGGGGASPDNGAERERDEALNELQKISATLTRLTSEQQRAGEDVEKSKALLKEAESRLSAARKAAAGLPPEREWEEEEAVAVKLVETLARAEKAQKQLSAHTAESQGAEAALEAVRREGEALKADLDNVERQLKGALDGMSYAAAAAAAEDRLKKAAAAVDGLKKERAEREREIKRLEAEKSRNLGTHETLMKRAAQLKRPPPDEAERERAEAAAAQLEERKSRLHERKGALTGLIAAGEEKLLQKREKEKRKAALTARTDRLARLMKMFKGDAFLEYVSQEYIEDFCMTASHYLSKMSGGCYTMGYDCASAEFYVMDFRSGNLKRGVRTLSGGETFLASLSLAIAVSKSIAAGSGAGLKFDFLFLDEGFGTLHRDAIAVVERALRSLAKETLVGVVTHRSELSELISDRLYIESATAESGSRVRIIN